MQAGREDVRVLEVFVSRCEIAALLPPVSNSAGLPDRNSKIPLSAQSSTVYHTRPLAAGLAGAACLPVRPGDRRRELAGGGGVEGAEAGGEFGVGPVPFLISIFPFRRWTGFS